MDKILLVDDSSIIRRAYKDILEKKNLECLEAKNGLEALEILRQNPNSVRVLIVDQIMPLMDGFHFLESIREDKSFRTIPIIFVSSIHDSEFIKSVLALGIYDYLTKPIDNDVFYLKVKNAVDAHHRELYLKQLNNYIAHKNEELENTVKIRTAELNDMLYALLVALENANYINDNDTGKHIHRVARFSEFIAKKFGLDNTVVNQIKLFAPIHDIGKVGINSSIIKKPGKLTVEEFEEIKKHVTIGYEMLKDAPLPEIAKNIIRYHHEKWNGKGYAFGLSGFEIPIEARIVAISDVFDAIINKRVYKEALPIEEVITILKKERGESFQTELVDIVLDNIDEMQKINSSF